MLKTKIAALAVAVCLVGSSAGVFADNVGPGLGRVLLKGKSGKLMELVGMTLNGICGNGMFAITFGTLGYQDKAVIGMASADSFIAENMDALASDIAKGNGEYLDTLAMLMNVSDTASFKNAVQANFDNIYTSADVTSAEVSARIKAIVG